jgi:glycerate 2-kinase
MIRYADLVITGEGHSDRQTLMGKLPQRILEHVLNNKATTDQQIWLVSGGVSEKQALLDAGFDQVLAVSPQNMDLEEAMNPKIAKRNIANAIRVFFGND